MRIFIIRHPETEANARKLIYGRTESEYTPKGLVSMDWVLQKLKDQRIDAIYTSPLQRTVKLAQAISSVKGCPVIEGEALREMDFGVFENMTRAEAEERFPDYFQCYMADYTRYRIQGGESFQDVLARLSAFITPIIKEEGAIILVTHGMVMKAAISLLLGIAPDLVWHFKTVPATLMEIDYRSEYGVLVALSAPEDAADSI